MSNESNEDMTSALVDIEGSTLTLGRAPYGLKLGAEHLGLDANEIFGPEDANIPLYIPGLLLYFTELKEGFQKPSIRRQ